MPCLMNIPYGIFTYLNARIIIFVGSKKFIAGGINMSEFMELNCNELELIDGGGFS